MSLEDRADLIASITGIVVQIGTRPSPFYIGSHLIIYGQNFTYIFNVLHNIHYHVI